MATITTRGSEIVEGLFSTLRLSPENVDVLSKRLQFFLDHYKLPQNTNVWEIDIPSSKPILSEIAEKCVEEAYGERTWPNGEGAILTWKYDSSLILKIVTRILRAMIRTRQERPESAAKAEPGESVNAAANPNTQTGQIKLPEPEGSQVAASAAANPSKTKNPHVTVSAASKMPSKSPPSFIDTLSSTGSSPEYLKFANEAEMMKAIHEWMRSHLGEKFPAASSMSRSHLNEDTVRIASCKNGKLGVQSRFQIDSHAISWMITLADGGVIVVRWITSNKYEAWLGGDLGFSNSLGITTEIVRRPSSTPKLSRAFSSERFQSSTKVLASRTGITLAPSRQVISSPRGDIVPKPPNSGSTKSGDALPWYLVKESPGAYSTKFSLALKIFRTGAVSPNPCTKCVAKGVACYKRSPGQRCSYCCATGSYLRSCVAIDSHKNTDTALLSGSDSDLDLSPFPNTEQLHPRSDKKPGAKTGRNLSDDLEWTPRSRGPPHSYIKSTAKGEPSQKRQKRSSSQTYPKSQEPSTIEESHLVHVASSPDPSAQAVCNSNAPIMFQFWLSRTELGAKIIPEDLCASSIAFFDHSQTSYLTSVSRKVQVPQFMGVQVKWDQLSIPCFVPWRDEHGYRTMMDQARLAPPDKNGHIYVRVQCILQDD